MNIDIFHESKSEFRQNVSAINLGRHNRQIKDVRVEHLESDSIAMHKCQAGLSVKFRIKYFLSFINLSKFTKSFKDKVYFAL